MNTRWILPFLVSSLCVLTLSMLYLSRKPLCIDSKVVERIDRDSETVYQCSRNKQVPFSVYFNQNLPRIEARIQQVEKFLERVAPMTSKIRLVIVTNNPSQFAIQDNTIYISEAMLDARGHIEKALFKKWYRENSQNLFAYENLFEEVFTDFMIYLVKGNLKIEDPFRGVQTKLNGSRWPQVLKSMQAYCQSPWKRSEHYQLCRDIKSRAELKGDQILELSLRPLLVSAWIRAYRGLDFKDQYQFVKLIRDLISTEHIPELPLVRTGGVIPDSDPLAEASEAIKNISYFLTSSYLTQYSQAHRVFITLVANNLGQFGFNDSFGGANFDVLVVSDKKVQTTSDIFKHLLELSKKNPTMKIAVKDGTNLWMLPSIYPVPWKSMDSLRADRIVYNKCGHYDFKFVWGFSNVTDKLMIVNSCGDKKINLTSYLKEGAEGFGSQNKNVGFIQFHIPSLLMRKDQLSHVDNIYDLVSKREIDNPVFQSLGWREIKYSEKAEAYQPKSFVDGIEWFKIQ